MWRILGLHPMQFNPNSYMLLAGLLAMGKKWDVSLGISDLLFCHYLAHITETDWSFNFSPRPLRKFFEERTCNFSSWKSEALMAQGEWAAPVILTVIPKAFSKRAASLKTEEELEKKESAGMDIRGVKLPAGRKSSKKPKLTEGTIGSARSGFENVHIEVDSSLSKKASRTLSLLQTNLPNSPHKSASDHSAISLSDTHLVTCPNVSSSSLKFPLLLNLTKGEDSYVLEGDPIAFDKETCLAVGQSLAMNNVDLEKLFGLSLKDISAQIALGLQSSSSMVQNLMMRMEASELQLWRLIKEARQEAEANAIKLEETRAAFEDKCKVVDANEKEVSEMKTKLRNEITNRAKEFELSQNEINKSSYKYYRLGWVQGQ